VAAGLVALVALAETCEKVARNNVKTSNVLENLDK
jgi:hypothetical protein